VAASGLPAEALSTDPDAVDGAAGRSSFMVKGAIMVQRRRALKCEHRSAAR
jgi:hypothetical protein